MQNKAYPQSTTIPVKFDRPAREPNYDLLLARPDHPLIRASSAALAIVQSDREHNEYLVQMGYTCHRGSRANNVIPLDKFQGLTRDLEHSKSVANPMNGRPVNIDNLYRLKTGARKGAYLGANLFNFSSYHDDDQLYIATEAPYHPEDYFRMVIDTGSRVLVSVTTEADNGEEAAFFKIRDGIRIDLHHLPIHSHFQIDEQSLVTSVQEVTRAPRFGGAPLTVAHYKVTDGDNSYFIHHIKYKDWLDNYPGHNSCMLELIAAINEAQQELQTDSKHPITVNCGFGYGRTASLILIHQISRIIPDITRNQNLASRSMVRDEDIQLDLPGMIYALQEQLAYKALIGLGGCPEDRFNKFYAEVQQVVGALIRSRLAGNY